MTSWPLLFDQEEFHCFQSPQFRRDCDCLVLPWALSLRLHTDCLVNEGCWTCMQPEMNACTLLVFFLNINYFICIFNLSYKTIILIKKRTAFFVN